MIKINGQEGGGQLLRSALSLSLITGKPFHMSEIRGKRQKPGLMRQHLSCVKAALEVGKGAADGAELLSEELIFHPGSPQAGEYHINIGSAGSAVLVAQTLIPALVNLDGPSTLTIEGGTHNPMAPSFHFLEQQFLPCLQEMGYDVVARLVKTGFVPAGGGCLEVKISPHRELTPLQRKATGELETQKALIYHYQLGKIVEKITTLLQKKERSLQVEVMEAESAACKGMTVQLVNEYSGDPSYTISTEMVAEHGLRAEGLVQKLKKAHHVKHAIKVPVCNRLADQLMLFQAQVPGSEIISGPVTNHIKTNVVVINSFLTETLSVHDLDNGRLCIQS